MQAKSNSQNDLQVACLGYRPDAARFGGSFDEQVKADVFAALLADGELKAIRRALPADLLAWPSLADDRMVADAQCLRDIHAREGRADRAAALDEQLRTRTSSAWLNVDAIALCRQFLGKPQLPPPTEPERPKPTDEYLAAATLIVEACAKQGITLAIVDPNRPQAAPTRCLGARAAGDMPAADIVKRIEAGFLLAWVPTGRRLIPPSIEVPGHAWRELEAGSGVVLAPVEGEPKAPAKRGAK